MLKTIWNKIIESFDYFCKNNLDYENIPEVKITRISARETKYHKPMKVEFEDIIEKRKFLSSLYKLETDEEFKKINIQHDMCEEDRNENKKLLKKAWEQNQAEKPDNFRYKVRGPPWNMAIVKVFAKNGQRNK